MQLLSPLFFSSGSIETDVLDFGLEHLHWHPGPNSYCHPLAHTTSRKDEVFPNPYARRRMHGHARLRSWRRFPYSQKPLARSLPRRDIRVKKANALPSMKVGTVTFS